MGCDICAVCDSLEISYNIPCESVKKFVVPEIRLCPIQSNAVAHRIGSYIALCYSQVYAITKSVIPKFYCIFYYYTKFYTYIGICACCFF